MRITDLKTLKPEEFVVQLLKLDFPKNEAARLFLAAMQDQRDNETRVDSMIRYYEFLNDRKHYKLARIKNEGNETISFQNCGKNGTLELKPRRTIVGLLEDDILHMVEGFSTVNPRSIYLNISTPQKPNYSITLLNKLKWSF